MDHEYLHVTDDNRRLRHLVIDRPAQANALNASMMLAMALGVRQASDAGATAIVISGAPGSAFCAGADIKEFVQSDAHLRAQEHALQELVHAMLETSLPVITLAHGRVMGAGAMVTSMSDIVIAAANLVIGFPEITFNMYPGIAHAVLMQKVPASFAEQLCLTGRLLTASEALACGLVSEITASDCVFEHAANARLDFFAARMHAMTIGKRAARLTRPPEDLKGRLAALSPLLMENFTRPGVRQGIADYARGLGMGKG